MLNYRYGTFNMEGGSISNNTNTENSISYSAISIASGEFNLSGGLIENNIGGQIVSIGGGSFNMMGGTISNNTASVGVLRIFENGNFAMSDGVISDNFK